MKTVRLPPRTRSLPVKVIGVGRDLSWEGLESASTGRFDEVDLRIEHRLVEGGLALFCV